MKNGQARRYASLTAIALAIGAVTPSVSAALKPRPHMLEFVERLLTGRSAAAKPKLAKSDRLLYDKLVSGLSKRKLSVPTARTLFKSLLKPATAADAPGIVSALGFQAATVVNPSLGKVVGWLDGELGTAEKLRGELACKGDGATTSLVARLRQARKACTFAAAASEAKLGALTQSQANLGAFESVVAGSSGDVKDAATKVAALSGLSVDAVLNLFMQEAANPPDPCQSQRASYEQLDAEFKKKLDECTQGSDASCAALVLMPSQLLTRQTELTNCVLGGGSSDPTQSSTQTKQGITMSMDDGA